MVVFFIIMLILGKVFASVGHISDSTAKAMGWIILNKIVSIISLIFIFVGGIMTLGYFLFR